MYCNNVILPITGPPLKPEVQLVQQYLADNFVLHNISWSTPFSWTEFPVTNFTISMYNYSNREILVTILTAYTTDWYTYLTLSSGEHCYAIDYTVVAKNAIGESQLSILSTGHPIGNCISNACNKNNHYSLFN